MTYLQSSLCVFKLSKVVLAVADLLEAEEEEEGEEEGAPDQAGSRLSGDDGYSRRSWDPPARDQAAPPFNVPAGLKPDLSVYVVGLERSASTFQLRSKVSEMFSMCGPLASVTVDQDSEGQITGRAFVAFRNPNAKLRALQLDGVQLGGQRVSVADMGILVAEPAPAGGTPGGVRPPPGGWKSLGDESDTVFVKGLDTSFSEDELRLALYEAFGECGRIVQVSV